jgi:large subunit ribosomal protein L17
MRHGKAYRKHGRRSGARKVLLQSLVSGLFLTTPTEDHAERITTTIAKAKDARRFADKLITLGKKGTLTARRRALQLLPNKRVVRKLFAEIAPRYADRPGGYTRILTLGKRRVGDDAPQCLLELVGLSETVEAAPEKPVVADETSGNDAEEPKVETAVEVPAEEEAAEETTDEADEAPEEEAAKDEEPADEEPAEDEKAKS